MKVPPGKMLLMLVLPAWLVLFTNVHASPVAPVQAEESGSRRAASDPDRSWHASVSLRQELANEDAPIPAALLELARAEAGWQNWPAVEDLLQGAPWLDSESHGEGWFLLGRAAEAKGEWAAAERAFNAYLAEGARREEVVLRLIRLRARLGRSEDALAALEAVTSGRTSFFNSRVRLEVAELLAPLGDTAGVRLANAGMTDEDVRERGWLLRLSAYLTAGDSASAMAFLERTVAAFADGGRRARGWATLGRLRQARGDEEGAQAAFRAVLEASDRGGVATTAARAIIRSGTTATDELPELGRILERGGDTGLALQLYDRYLAESPEAPPVALRLARARLLSGTDRLSEARAELSDLAESADPAIGVPALDNLARVLRRLGEGARAGALREELVERFPGSQEAVDVIFFRADADHDAGRLSGAMEGYRRTASMAPSMDRAGLARMRLGQLHTGTGDHETAVTVFEGYLADFPAGRRWREAAYWAAWNHIQMGDRGRAAEHVARIVSAEPFDYYAFLGAELLGESYDPVLEPDPPVDEAGFFWIYEPLSEAGLLRRAGMTAAAREATERLAEQAEDSPGALLRLAEGLIAEGMHIEGIRLGGAARAAGYPRSLRLVRAVYPLPYREIIFEEAAERSVDPFLMAALIRQESAFDAGIVSGAGAVGLMQVMPATGREIARRDGPSPLTESSLKTPDVNLHLGSRYLADMLDRYAGQLPLVLSAYNAGPSRANRWSRLPEASDLLRLTERIPFRETRLYVKSVTRNAYIYRWLYGAEQ